jgi:hypothetical protein
MTATQEKVDRAAELLRQRRQGFADLSVSVPQQDTGEPAFSGVDAAREALKTRQDAFERERRSRLDSIEPSALERIVSLPIERFKERGAATMERIAATKSLTESPTDPGSVLLQTFSNPVSLGFDMASNLLLVGAEGALGFVLPDQMQEDAKQALVASLQTETGQRALKALSDGEEAWNKFSQSYPNEAANWAGFADIAFGLPRQLITDISPDLMPASIKAMGGRKALEPMEGIDKDIYNIAFSRMSGKTVDQAKRTTDPQGIMGSQKQVATRDELLAIDELKLAGVRGNRTMQENLNSMLSYLDNLDNAVIGLARKESTPVNLEKLRANVAEEILNVIEDNREIFKGAFSSEDVNTAIDSYVKSYMRLVTEFGDSVEGVISARRKFDDDAERFGIDLGSSRTSADILLTKAVRTGMNNTIFESVPKAEKLFSKMSKVLGVTDNVAMKAAREATTSLGRLVTELGLKDLIGIRAGSQLINIPIAAAYGVVMSPVVMLRRAMKADYPARGRALVQYALRDVKAEIAKGLQRVKDPQKKKSLLASQPAAYAALEAAARKLEKEYDDLEEETNPN